MTLAQHWAQIETTEQWVLRGETGFLRRRPDASIERALELATFDGAEVHRSDYHNRSGPIRVTRGLHRA